MSAINELIDKKNQLNKLSRKLENARYSVAKASQEVEFKDEVVKRGEENKGYGSGCAFIVIIVLLLWISFFYPAYSASPDDFGLLILGIITPAGIITYCLYEIISQIFYQKEREAKYKKTLNKKENLNSKKNKIYYQSKKIEKEIVKMEKTYHINLVEHFTKNYDKNKNKELDVLEIKDDYLNYLKANQDKIIEISEKMGEDYIHTLIKINDKLNLKRSSLNTTLSEILKLKQGFDSATNIESLEELLKNEIQYYNSLLANSLFMASSLVNNDRITFRTIYEKFDKLNFFNTNYENQTLSLLSNINNNLQKILIEIYNMNASITSAIEDLTFATQENTEKISKELKSIDSSINFNTLVASINAYQNYKTNKNTKSLR